MKLYSNDNDITDDSQSQERSDWLQKQVLTKPKDEETANEVTHAEQTDAWRARDKQNQQCYPEGEVEDDYLHVIQIRADNKSQNKLT